MKKLFLILVLFLFLISTFNGCIKSIEDNNTTVENTTQDVTESVSSIIETPTTEKLTEAEKSTEKQTNVEKETDEEESDDETTTKKEQSNPLISDEDMSKIENSQAEVYFSDNPDNKYISAVANKYGVEKNHLIALIKVNAEFPSTIVMQFSGKTDENGELIMTYNEFKYIYEIDETDNSIIKVSKNGLDNDGVTFIEAKVYVLLAKEYLIPELPDIKANKRYPE